MKRKVFSLLALLCIIAGARAQETLVFKGLADDQWSTQANWVLTDDTPANRLPAAADDVSIEALCYLNTTATAKSVTVQKDAILVLNENSNLGDIPLIVEDGAQLYPVDYQYELKATVKKEIKSNRWYLLSIPVDIDNDATPDFEGAGMLEGNYDLFLFDQDEAGTTEEDEDYGEWRNYKYYVQNGKEQDFIMPSAENEPLYFGYLYANGANTTLSFQGAICTDAEWSNVRLDWNNSAELVGFNLIANPYPCNAEIVCGNKIDEGQMHMMKEDGSGLALVDLDASWDRDTLYYDRLIVPPFAALFFFATANNRNASVTFSPVLFPATITAAEDDDACQIYLPAHNQTGNHDADEELPVIPVTGVTLSQTEAAMTMGETLTLTDTVDPYDGTNRMVTWTTSDAAVATVTDTGIVTAVGEGTATITVTATNGTADDTSDDKTATCTVTVTAGTTQYAVTVKDGTADTDKWTASPNPAEAGETVTVTYSGKKKVKSVTVTKKEEAVAGHALSASVVGEVVGTDGLAYAVADKDNLPSGVTAAGMVAYKSGSNGLVIALSDEAEEMYWSTAIDAAAAHTPTVGTYLWKLPSIDEWKLMLEANGGNVNNITGLNTAIENAGGTPLLLKYIYWSSSVADEEYANCVATYANGNVVFGDSEMNDDEDLVRAYLAF